MIMFKVGKTKNGKPIHSTVQSLFSSTLKTKLPEMRLAFNRVPPNLGNIKQEMKSVDYLTQNYLNVDFQILRRSQA